MSFTACTSVRVLRTTRLDTLIIDEIKIDDRTVATPVAPEVRSAPRSPKNVQAKGYDRHIDISWDPVTEGDLQSYAIYRSIGKHKFQPIGIQSADINRYTDFIGRSGVTATYRVKAVDRSYRQSALSGAATASTRELSDDELLTMLQEACFRYYWEGAHPMAGATLENIPGDERIVATGASGFGIMALIVGVDRGFITREQGIERLTKILDFLEKTPRYHGAWAHFLNGNTAQTMLVFGMFDNGGDLVETSFLWKDCWPPASTLRAMAKPARVSIRELPSFGKPSSGIGIGVLLKTTRCCGIGLRSGPGSSITG